MGTQDIYLKWNNHQSNMLTVFEHLLSSESFVDVTLSCEGTSLKAHKMVLSSCSPLFQNLFLENPCQHPIVIMKDIRYTDLKAIVDFVYKGEISVSKDQLSALRNTAAVLKIKGMAEVIHDNTYNKSGSLLREQLESPVLPSNVEKHQDPALHPLNKRKRRPLMRSILSSRMQKQDTDSQPLNKRKCLENVSSNEDQIAPKDNAISDFPEVSEETAESQLFHDTEQSFSEDPSSSKISQKFQSSIMSSKIKPPNFPELIEETSEPQSFHDNEQAQSCSEDQSSVRTISNFPEIIEESSDLHLFHDTEDRPTTREPSVNQSTTENMSVFNNNSVESQLLPVDPSQVTLGVLDLQSLYSTLNSCDNQVLLPCALPSEHSTQNYISQQDNQDIKLGVVFSYEEPPIVPVNDPPHNDNNNPSMMIYTDEAGVSRVLYPNNYQLTPLSQQDVNNSQKQNKLAAKGSIDDLDITIEDDQLLVGSSMNTKKKFLCHACGRSFTRLNNFNQHKRIHEKKRGSRFMCKYCGQKFEHMGHLGNHIRSKHKGDRAALTNSQKQGKVTLKDDNSSTQNLVNQGGLPFTVTRPKNKVGAKRRIACDICSQTFSNRGNLLRHKTVHDKDRPFSCIFCDFRFKRKDTLEDHVKRKHLVETGILKSNQEHEKVPSRDDNSYQNVNIEYQKDNLLTVDNVNAENQFVCNICGRSFSRQVSLDKHMKFHERNTNSSYKCQLCQNIFSRKDQLKKHMRTKHLSTYGKVTLNDGTSDLNVAIHHSQQLKVSQLSTERRYSCNVCGRSYMKRDSLNRHKKSHGSETVTRPHICKFCDCRFIRKSHLDNHTNRKHFSSEIKPQCSSVKPQGPVIKPQCPICNKIFSTQDGLLRHERWALCYQQL